jgi:serine protease Do
VIDPSGLAVTNNHVVTGAALLKVWVGGESDPRNARVLGVSECADLAVIDIDGDGYPYLRWYDGDIQVGMDMYVAGYPLGDPEFTLTRGIVSKDEAGGETSWASVESTLEYDATTNPGNSGGPVITPDAAVIGVHFAGNSQTRQAFGIAAQYARGVIDELQFGRDVDSIGVNGQAVVSDDGSLTGIWVSSVKSGSPADRAGLRGPWRLTATFCEATPRRIRFQLRCSATIPAKCWPGSSTGASWRRRSHLSKP